MRVPTPSRRRLAITLSAALLALLGACGDSGGGSSADTADATSGDDTAGTSDTTVSDTSEDDAADAVEDTGPGDDADAADVSADSDSDAADTSADADADAATDTDTDAAGCPEGQQDNDHDGVCAPACATGSCSDHGICTDNVGVVICVCDDGYDGDACETDVDDCVGVACLQGGTCVDEVDGFHCDCPTGYGGTLCDACATGYQDEDADGVCAVDCTLTTCADHESCSVVAGAATCGCVDGYRRDDTSGDCVESICGDGVIDPADDEECEPGVGSLGSVCDPTSCHVDCAAIDPGFDTLTLATGCYFKANVASVSPGEAATLCDDLGAHLVTLTSYYEDVRVNDHYGLFWLALTVTSDGVVDATWADGEPVDYVSDTWNPQVGSAGWGDTFCVYANPSGWDNAPCYGTADAICEIDTCGDGVVTSNEECDDGNDVDGDGCDTNCTVTACGNGVLNDGETCDDANTDDSDTCPSDCQLGCAEGVDNWTSVTTTPYGCYLFFDSATTWAIAETRCEALGGIQAKVTSRAVEDRLVTASGGKYFWGGATDLATEGEWLWADGTPLTGYEHWTENAPDAAAYSCFQVTPWGWDDGRCNINLRYICEVSSCGNGTLEGREVCDDGNTTDGDGCDSNCRPTGCGNEIVTAGEACDDGNLDDGDGCTAGCQLPCDTGSGADAAWEHDGHCYSVFLANKTPTNAEFACQAFGAHLASIGSAEENAFIFGLVGGLSVIGLTDEAVEGTFVWTNGDTSDYRNWTEDEPGSGGDTRDCVYMLEDGTWYDEDCGRHGRYVCESAPNDR